MLAFEKTVIEKFFSWGPLVAKLVCASTEAKRRDEIMKRNVYPIDFIKNDCIFVKKNKF
jgi:hypothetical protein